jgi:4a-hydroxytetrahydrobiopterin dehydratase
MDTKLSHQEISDAVSGLGWRYVLATVRSSVRVGSLARAAEVAGRVVAVAGAEGGLRLDLRADRLILTLQSPATQAVTRQEIELARQIAATLGELGLRLDPGVEVAGQWSPQLLELAIDALDIGRIRPFWKAVLGYTQLPGSGELSDPRGVGPALWFQQMTEPRPQRNRIHFDMSVPHDEAPLRVQAALDAGGVLVSDRQAPAFWVLADAEGNEVCVTTWQGRD